MTSVLVPDTSVIASEKSSEAVIVPSGDNSPFNPILLGKYYSKLFPYRFLHSWLSYDTSYLQPKAANAQQSLSSRNLFSRREFSFTIEPTPGEEIYIRYQSFETESEFAAAVNKRRPTKIDIGAVFTFSPKDHLALQGSSTRKFTTEQRELVFDVDLTDYDGVRKCGCSQANICSKCWKMMTMAMKVMDAGLREDFGFENIAWIYSGRRGVHAWVCDETARTLSNEGRSAVATYFQVRVPIGVIISLQSQVLYFRIGL
jgi:DNA primase small subunit